MHEGPLCDFLSNNSHTATSHKHSMKSICMYRQKPYFYHTAAEWNMSWCTLILCHKFTHTHSHEQVSWRRFHTHTCDCMWWLGWGWMGSFVNGCSDESASEQCDWRVRLEVALVSLSYQCSWSAAGDARPGEHRDGSTTQPRLPLSGQTELAFSKLG